MKKLAILCLLLLIAAPSFGQTAQEYYVLAEAAWNRGDVDAAIAGWRSALELKPDSSLTKDRLIQALNLKMNRLLSELQQLQSKNAGLQAEIDKLKATPVPAVRAVEAAAKPPATRAATEPEPEPLWTEGLSLVARSLRWVHYGDPPASASKAGRVIDAADLWYEAQKQALRGAANPTLIDHDLVGEVKNLTGKPFRSVTVSVGVYETKTKVKVKTSQDVITDLMPNTVARFRCKTGIRTTVGNRVPFDKQYYGVIERIRGIN